MQEEHHEAGKQAKRVSYLGYATSCATREVAYGGVMRAGRLHAAALSQPICSWHLMARQVT